ncbi:MauE/DoxX family redox-associated membrane protein [Paenibacillus elgii]|uniref:MauE/DoxX family redox-associated membrane protein n=1 Tax=Paenibacillus elgii TaxID=189691 RepID=UPI0026AEC559
MILQTSLPLILSFIFLLSACSKLFSYSHFLDSIRDLNINFINKNNIHAISRFVILTEIYLGTSFAFHFYLSISYLISKILIFIFSLYLIKARLQHKDIRCTCFGKSENYTNIPLALIRNVIIIIGCLYGILYSHTVVCSLEISAFSFLSMISSALLVYSYKEMKFYIK